VTATAHPLDWHFHIFWTVALPVLLLAYFTATRARENRPTRRQLALFVLGVVLLAGAVLWPLGDLAAHWSLVALVLQRLLLMLAVPPLLVAGTPRPVLAWLTRPAPIDAVLRVIVRPLPAVAIVTAVAVGTLTTGAVNEMARSDAVRVALQLLVLAAGCVLWAPALSQLPGAKRLSSLGRGGYLIVQSIVPSFLSIVWIFARHPLYPPFDHRTRFAGMSAVLDQQLAGFVAKLSTIAVLWTVAFVIMTRSADGNEDGDPLIWSDVEREIERAERRQRRSVWRPPPMA